MDKKVLSKKEFADSVQTTIQLSNRDKSKLAPIKAKRCMATRQAL